MTLRLLMLPTWVLALAITGLAVAGSLLGTRLVVFKSYFEEPVDNAAVVALHATVATIYTVLLAFVVVIVWQQFSDSSAHVETEATRLSNILRDSEVFPPGDKQAINDAVGDYVTLASTREWDAMAAGTAPDAATNAAYEQIWEVVYRIEPEGFRQESFYREMLVRLNELGAARRTRLLSAHASVPSVMWSLLVSGFLLVVVLSYLLPHRGRGSKLALATTSSVIALTLFLIFVMDHPYSGDLHVDPSPLTDLLPRTAR
jgi:hypothetical protein